MNLAEACEPFFQCICRVNRSARKGGSLDMPQVRTEIKTLLADCRTRGVPVLNNSTADWDKAEIILLYFTDSVIHRSRLPWAKEWKDLAAERGRTAGDEDFFDELEKTIADGSDAATERIGLFYVCMGLGFSGWFAGDPAKLRQYMAQMASRLRGTMDSDRAAKVCPEAYAHVNTTDLVEPPGRKLIGVGIALAGLALTVIAANIVLFKSEQVRMREALSSIAARGEQAAKGLPGAGSSGGSAR